MSIVGRGRATLSLSAVVLRARLSVHKEGFGPNRITSAMVKLLAQTAESFSAHPAAQASNAA